MYWLENIKFKEQKDVENEISGNCNLLFLSFLKRKGNPNLHTEPEGKNKDTAEHMHEDGRKTACTNFLLFLQNTHITVRELFKRA